MGNIELEGRAEEMYGEDMKNDGVVSYPSLMILWWWKMKENCIFIGKLTWNAGSIGYIFSLIFKIRKYDGDSTERRI